MTAPTTTWAGWIRLHATIFGHHEPRDVEMLQAWASLFAAEGWSPDELADASRWVAINDPPRFRTDALCSLQNRVRGVRRRLADSEAAQGHPGGSGCEQCDSTGWVVVPDVKVLRAGGWGVCLATCTCGLGHWRRIHGDGRPSVALWDEHMPDWRLRLKEHEEAIRARMVAEQEASGLDKTLGQLQRLIESGGLKGRPPLEEK